MSDQQLLQGLKQGDESSFSEIYERYWQRLLGIAYHLIRDKDLAECIVQDVFVSLWHRRDTVEIVSLDSYLSTAIRFATYKTIYRNRRKEEIRQSFHVDTYSNIDEQQIDALFLKEYLQAGIEQLPSKCKLVFKLSRDAQQSNKEIAEQLEISEKSVEAHINRALKFLRKHLNKVKILLFLGSFIFFHFFL